MAMRVVEYDIGYVPNKYQVQLHRDVWKYRFGIIVAHRRFGKTYFAVADCFDRAIRDSTERGRYGYIAPYLKQAKDVAWGLFKQFASRVPDAKINESELKVTLPNGATIRLYGADNADSIRGGYFNHVVVDEVADMKPFVWGEVIRPMLSDYKGSALFIGTPKGTNLFSDLWYAAQGDDAWFTAMFRADETDRIDAEELESARKQMSDNQFRQEYLCDFAASADNILITIDMVVDACKRAYRRDEIAHAPVVLGVDVARYGEDKSCIFRRQGLVAHKPVVMSNVDNMELAGRVLSQIKLFKPDMIFIDAGRGEGVIDRLRSLGYEDIVMEVPFGGKPMDDHYTHKRCEMWDTMAKWVRDSGQLPSLSELKSDLTAPTYSYANAANKFKLEAKEKTKERLSRSPDIADALALTFAYPVHKQVDTDMGLYNNGTHKSEYRPL